MWRLKTITSSLGNRQQLTQTDSELFDSLEVCHLGWQAVPILDGLGKERVFVCVLTVAVGWYSVNLWCVCRWVAVTSVHAGTVSSICFLPLTFECLPTKIVNHPGDTSRISLGEVTMDKSSCLSLVFLKLVGILCTGRVPSWGCIFQCWSNKRGVCSNLHFLGTFS